jgi:hypothetical protein
MKKIVLAALVLSIVTLFACKKDGDGKSYYPFVYLHHCINKTFSQERITLCFEEVIQDSRCPVNAFCIWGGMATAKFTFTRKNNDHVLILNLNRDTVVDGYKIRFADLLPYPKLNTVPAPSTIRATMDITRL